MSPIICPFCEKPSPPEAKFCSACGGALHLAPCPSCGAVNDVLAAACYQCRAALPGGKADRTEEGPPPAAEAPAPKRRSHARAVAGIAALAVLGALGYYSYTQRTQDERTPPTAGEAAGRIEPAAAEVGKPAAAQSAQIPASKPAASSVPRVEPQTVESPKPKPPATRASARRGACTAAVVALGLCPPEARRTEPAQAAAAKAPAPQTRGEACTEAVAALGLCAPAPTQRGK